jgi:hypothetical protein
MPDTKSLSLPPSQKLKGEENYPIWANQLQRVLDANDLEDYINGAIQPVNKPRDTTRDEATIVAYKKWKAGNANACLAIAINILGQPQQVIADCVTAKDMWETLKSQYEGKGHNLKQQHITKLTGIRSDNYNDITSFVIEFKSLVAKLSALKSEAPADWYIIMFIQALSNEFPAWAERQRSAARSSTPPTLSQLYVDINDESRGLTGPNSSALETQALYGSKARGIPGSKSAKGKSDKVCKHCKKTGHEESDCFTKHPNKYREFLQRKLDSLKIDSEKSKSKKDNPNDDDDDTHFNL